MLLGAERLWIALGQTADDRECRQLRFGGKPIPDRCQMRIKLGPHANPLLVTPPGPAMSRARLDGLGRLSERLRKVAGVRQW